MDYDDPTPAGVISETWRWLPAAVVVTVAVLLLVGGITLVGWQANWWFQSHNATRQAQNTQNGYSNQATLRAQVTTQLATVYSLTTQIAEAKGDQSLLTALEPQRMSVAGIVCADAAQVTGTPLPAQQAQWVTANCSGGTVSPNSPLYQQGQP
jgi:hypothetical protein